MKWPLYANQRSALLALAVLLALLVAVQAAFADDTPPQPTATPAPLLPNDPLPELNAVGSIDGAQLHDQLLPEPFPVTAPSEQALQAVVNEYLSQAVANQSLIEDTLSTEAVFPQAIPAAPASVNLPLIRSGRVIVLPPTITPTPDPENRPSADVAVALWANPSVRVARNGTLTYELRVRNYGRGTANQTRIKLPFDRAQIVPIGSQLNTSAGDWVSELTNTSLTVTFGPISGGQERSGRVSFRVGANLVNNTVISTRGDYQWDDPRRTAGGATNWAPVLVGGGNDNAAYAWLIVEPFQGSATTTRGFFSDRFIPGEGITTWLNVPGGTVKPLSVRGTADQMGRVWMNYQPADLNPGTYQMVAYGNRSKLTAVVSFIVR